MTDAILVNRFNEWQGIRNNYYEQKKKNQTSIIEKIPLKKTTSEIILNTKIIFHLWLYNVVYYFDLG